jgi:hypothetical protein
MLSFNHGRHREYSPISPLITDPNVPFLAGAVPGKIFPILVVHAQRHHMQVF